MRVSIARDLAIKFWFRESYYTDKIEIQPLPYPEICRLCLYGNILAHRYLYDCEDYLQINILNHNKVTTNIINEILEFTRTSYRIDKDKLLRNDEIVQYLKSGDSITFINKDSRWIKV